MLYLCGIITYNTMKPLRNEMYTSGIYCIKNKINNKMYIGKSYNIYKRLILHRHCLNFKEKKHENDYLINAWNKYGEDNFECFVLEYCERNDSILTEREYYWITYYNTIDSEIGYNLRLDKKSYVCHESTRKLLSQRMYERYERKGEREKVSKRTSLFWANNPEVKKEMAKKVSKQKIKYYIEQYTRNNELITVYESINEVIEKNPSYKWQNIYSVCNDYKPTYMGFIWKKKLKI